jgi:hypothetical protein
VLAPECSEEQLQRASPAQLERFNHMYPAAFSRVYTEFKRRDDVGSLRALKVVLLAQKGSVALETFAKVANLFGPLSDPAAFFFKVSPAFSALLICSRSSRFS